MSITSLDLAISYESPSVIKNLIHANCSLSNEDGNKEQYIHLNIHFC